MNRRRFLQTLAAGTTAPIWLRYADQAVASGSTTRPHGGGLLLVVFLRGGNDPLNTVVPYDDAYYQRARPNIRLRGSEVLPMGNGMGWHASLPTFSRMWNAGQVAVIQQVGVPNPNFSHFISTASWDTASPERRYADGWLGRYLDATSAHGPVRAVALGETMPLMLAGSGEPGVLLDTISDFAFDDADAVDAQLRHGTFSSFGAGFVDDGSMRSAVLQGQRQMLDSLDPVARARARYDGDGHAPSPGETIGQLFAAGIGTEVGYVLVDRFDTHTDQRTQHAGQLAQLDTVTSDFFTAASRLGVANQSAVVVISEFGRRVYENASQGTDHGAANNVYILGGGVRGGMYGSKLDLSTLDDGNLPVRIDLRSVYATVLEQWMNVPHQPILGGRYVTLPVFS